MRPAPCGTRLMQRCKLSLGPSRAHQCAQDIRLGSCRPIRDDEDCVRRMRKDPPPDLHLCSGAVQHSACSAHWPHLRRHPPHLRRDHVPSQVRHRCAGPQRPQEVPCSAVQLLRRNARKTAPARRGVQSSRRVCKACSDSPAQMSPWVSSVLRASLPPSPAANIGPHERSSA